MTLFKEKKPTGGPSEAGFSLIGMMITMSIGLTLATLVWEVGSEMARSAKTAAAGAEVAAAMREARQMAMTEHRVIFVGFVRGEDDRLARILLLRDDGSRVFESENDPIVTEIRFDLDVRLGDGSGAETSLPSGNVWNESAFGFGFGPRGEARDPTDGSPLTGFLNISAGGARRGSSTKFANLRISPSGTIANTFHRTSDEQTEEGQGEEPY